MTGNPRFAFDCRRRFLEAYAKTVLALDPAPFREKHDELIAMRPRPRATSISTARRWSASPFCYEDLITGAGEDLSDDPMEQLTSAARAVYRSLMSDRASTYRRFRATRI